MGPRQPALPLRAAHNGDDTMGGPQGSNTHPTAQLQIAGRQQGNPAAPNFDAGERCEKGKETGTDLSAR
jgi:hypothetical protein